MPHVGTDAGGAHAYQHLVVPGDRHRDVVEREDLG
jgi:hypothetical protein